MIASAKFSPDRRFRYWLLRVWDEQLPRYCFIGLNPSTADETDDDPTIRKIMQYVRSWQGGSVLMLNLYAYCATKPSDMKHARAVGRDIVGGPENFIDAMRARAAEHRAVKTVAAWGNDPWNKGWLLKQDVWQLDCLTKNKDGSPTHPLYLPWGLLPEPWNY